MFDLVRQAGEQGIAFVRGCGEVLLLFLDTLRSLTRYRLRGHLVAEQLYFIGVKSVTVVAVTGIFTGAVFAAQIQFQFKYMGLNSGTGPVVTLAMFRELGPVLCSLMVAGRVGSAMAAELATMKISEQIDALRALAVYPTEYLVVPRVLAMAIAMPILTALCIFMGVVAGYFVFTQIIGQDGTYYAHYSSVYTDQNDVAMGLIKGFFFGIIVALISCHRGLASGQGAAGVGHATTDAVVVSSLAVLVANFFFTYLLNAFLE
jgi:phospholipid/cholesterol/gamma-HCH transport system permease protein